MAKINEGRGIGSQIWCDRLKQAIHVLRARRDPFVLDREVKVQIHAPDWNAGEECCIGIMGEKATVIVRVDMRRYGAVTPETDEQLAAAFEFTAMAVDAQHYFEQWKKSVIEAERLRDELASIKSAMMAKVNLPERQIIDAEVVDANDRSLGYGVKK